METVFDSPGLRLIRWNPAQLFGGANQRGANFVNIQLYYLVAVVRRRCSERRSMR